MDNHMQGSLGCTPAAGNALIESCSDAAAVAAASPVGARRGAAWCCAWVQKVAAPKALGVTCSCGRPATAPSCAHLGPWKNNSCRSLGNSPAGKRGGGSSGGVRRVAGRAVESARAPVWELQGANRLAHGADGRGSAWGVGGRPVMFAQGRTVLSRRCRRPWPHHIILDRVNPLQGGPGARARIARDVAGVEVGCSSKCGMQGSGSASRDWKKVAGRGGAGRGGAGRGGAGRGGAGRGGAGCGQQPLCSRRQSGGRSKAASWTARSRLVPRRAALLARSPVYSAGVSGTASPPRLLRVQLPAKVCSSCEREHRQAGGKAAWGCGAPG
jgi:hypothetical protein